MPGLPTPIEKETVAKLWVVMLGFPGLLSVMLALTFFGKQDPSCPQWYIWLVRGGVALFTWTLGWLSAGNRFRELARRGRWVPPGAVGKPWLAAAYFSALVVPLMTVIWSGILYAAGLSDARVVCPDWVCNFGP
jgi:hypothetical protein